MSILLPVRTMVWLPNRKNASLYSLLVGDEGYNLSVTSTIFYWQSLLTQQQNYVGAEGTAWA